MAVWGRAVGLVGPDTDPRTQSMAIPGMQKAQPCGLGYVQDLKQKLLAPRPGLEPGTYGLTEHFAQEALLKR